MSDKEREMVLSHLEEMGLDSEFLIRETFLGYKWRRERKDIEEICKIQLEILNTCSKYLKKGGNLVYSTCSIFKQENEDIIEQFIKKSNFKIVKQKNYKSRIY